MAAEYSLSGLLSKLQASVESSVSALPEPEAVVPSQHGISLLDTKSELFLSYLQNLVFLILVKLRKQKQRLSSPSAHPEAADDADETPATLNELDDKAVLKLVELRTYLEKGVRPLEGRLKYQIDKVVRAADTASRTPTAKPPPQKRSSASSSAASASDDDGEEDIDELSYRPNPAALARAAPAPQRPRDQPSNGVYRPPRITPTALPSTAADPDAGPRARRAKPLRSSAVDEYIATELSGAPAAEPSIGSAITAGGRGTKSARDRARDDERRAYEEANFTRLPRESKKERGAARARERGNMLGEFDLGGLGDRVARATAKGGGGGAATKRGRDTADGPRGDGFGGGSVAARHGGGKKKKARRF